MPMSRAGRSEAGFTLLEILAVLVIIALLAAQVVPNLVGLAGFREARAVDKIEASLERAHEQAIRNARTITLRPGMFRADIPSGMSLSGEALQFYPNGGSSGGRWVLSAPERAAYFYDVDWLTGGVTTNSLALE